MKRRLVTLAAAMAAALSVATLGLWLISYFWTVGFAYQSSGSGVGMEVTGGRLLAGSGRQYTSPGWQVVVIRSRAPRYDQGWVGFVYDPARSSGGIHVAAAPLWFIALWPTLAACVLWRARRPPPGPHLCRTCGYDLRATPGRCPECGMEAKPRPAEGAAA